MLVLGVLIVSACQPDVKPAESRRERRPERRADSVDVARRRYVDARPQLAPDVRAAILEGRFVAGMTRRDARAVLGEGAKVEVEKSETEAHVHERWLLRRSERSEPYAILSFVDGELASVNRVN